MRSLCDGNVYHPCTEDDKKTKQDKKQNKPLTTGINHSMSYCNRYLFSLRAMPMVRLGSIRAMPMVDEVVLGALPIERSLNELTENAHRV